MKLLTLLVVAGIWFQADSGLSKTGKIVFKKRSIDFGSVYRGRQLTGTFSFNNQGEGPLKILGIHAACGCTVLAEEEKLQSTIYMPGEGGSFAIEFDTTDFVGKISKSVTVMTDQRHSPDRTITMRANIKSEIEAVPPLLDFGDVARGSPAVRAIRIKGVKGHKVKVSELSYNKSLFDTTFVQESDEWLVEVRLKSDIEPGFIRETLYVINSSDSLAKMPIPIRANIKWSVDVAPDYLEFGSIEQNSSSKRSLTFSGGAQFKLETVKAELLVNGEPLRNGMDFLDVSIVPHEQNKQLMSITLNNTKKYSGSVHGKLFFTTAAADTEKRSVDFYAFFR